MFESRVVSRTDLLNWLGIPKLALCNEKASRMVGGFLYLSRLLFPFRERVFQR